MEMKEEEEQMENGATSLNFKTDEENLSTVPSLSKTELYKEHQKTPIPLPPATAAPRLHPALGRAHTHLRSLSGGQLSHL